ncbi:shikimate kinase [Leadbettera azotonutricia]|uniref:Shikimate kinase n=1 Tax=Leadbettera azotonutricia (strain ATCC BAA-888 / DSM 13862 / ZAS-9) TaxID=545695 RepID=F5Y7H2_LEAAZ|nr:shikimate kinase [Leadbettera azotonutricia]AEF81286.1 shikimate kinase [Leadbettera azotonutricia ZAS-9]
MGKTQKRILLITGPKHAGKTEAGKALAQLLGGDFADLDGIVQRETGKTPRVLFKEGPEVFKKAEAAALKAVLEHTGENLSIIAAGGGLIDNEEAAALLRKSDSIAAIYLDVPAETAWQRILHTANGGELPPFLNTANPRQTHLELHERRAAAYKAIASIIIDGENKSPLQIAEEIKGVFCAAGHGPA